MGDNKVRTNKVKIFVWIFLWILSVTLFIYNLISSITNFAILIPSVVSSIGFFLWTTIRLVENIEPLYRWLMQWRIRKTSETQLSFSAEIKFVDEDPILPNITVSSLPPNVQLKKQVSISKIKSEYMIAIDFYEYSITCVLQNPYLIIQFNGFRGPLRQYKRYFDDMDNIIKIMTKNMGYITSVFKAKITFAQQNPLLRYYFDSRFVDKHKVERIDMVLDNGIKLYDHNIEITSERVHEVSTRFRESVLLLKDKM